MFIYNMIIYIYMWLEMDTSTYQLQNGLTGCEFIYGLTGLTESLNARRLGWELILLIDIMIDNDR